MEPISATKLITAIAAAIAPSIVKKIKKEATDMSDDMSHALSNTFSTYIQTAYSHHSFFSSIVFPNQQLLLKDYYIPLTLTIQKGFTSTSVVINEYPGELITDKKDILIVDTAGMGKSTVLKYMFLTAVEVNVGIPIFIELRKLNKNKTVLQFILEQLKTITKEVNEALVKRLIAAGDFVFFFDGYDEISDAERAAVTSDILDFKRLANKNYFIVSSRDQISLNAFSDFLRVTIQPLTKEEAFLLIEKYSKNSDLGKSLISNLKNIENQPINEFLTNPLLVSLLFKAYEHKHAIPLKKHVFYRQVFEALFENHDLSKDGGELNREKLCGLDIHGFEIIVRALGFISFESKRIEYSKDELLLLLNKVQILTPTIPIKSYELINDLVSRVPLFVVDGTSYRWSHKSIQEYFSAQYLVSENYEKQKKVLHQMYKSKMSLSYINFFSLFADINPKNFREIIITELIKELNEVFKETWPVPENVTNDDWMLRLSLCYLREIVIVRMDASQRVLANKEPHFNYIFKTASDELKRVNNITPSSGGYQTGKITAVIFPNDRYNFITQLCAAIKFDLFTSKLNRLNAPLKQTNDELIDSISKTLTFQNNSLVFSKDPKNIVNDPQYIGLLNAFLASRTPSINFDLTSGQALLKTIEAERINEQNMDFNF